MRIGVATSEDFPGLDPDDAPLLEALGEGAEPAIWSDPRVDWGAFDLILIRSVWDYFVRYEEFRAWLDRMDGLPVWNPVDTVRWNSEKYYLRELADAGVATIPTAWEGEVPWDDAIVKPTVAGGSLGLRRAKRGEPIGAGEMAQPFLPEITHGELSLVFFDGELSHAIRKTPAEGDIRVQPEHGGIVTAAAPTEEEVGIAKRVLEAAGRDLLYARVDLVGDGLLIELEAIEPRFFFSYAPPQAAGKLAQALRLRN
jgi:glutathione synthase/RimK-type ligase-like ATP-grasp enzyme